MNVNLSRLNLFFASLLFSFAPANMLRAQNTPLCFQILAPKIEAAVGDTVCVPVMTKGFNSIASMQFVAHWDVSDFEFVALGDLSQSALPGIIDHHILSQPSLGRVNFSWNDPNSMGVTLPDSSILFEVCLRVKKSEPGFYPFYVGSSPVLQYEVVKLVMPDWKSFMMPYAYQVGGVLVGSSAGTLAIESSCVSHAGCLSANGQISVSVTGGLPPYQFQWAGHNGFTSSNPGLTGVPSGTYYLTVTDQNGETLSSILGVNSLPNTIQTTVTKTDAVCDAAAGCIKLTVKGDNPPYSFQWSTGQPMGLEHCGLQPGTYKVTVTDAIGCNQVRTSTVVVQPLPSVWLSPKHFTKCGEPGKITLNVSPFQSSYTYFWSSGATTKDLEVTQPGYYVVTVTFSSGCTSTSGTQIYDYMTPNWGLNLATACDPNTEGQGTAVLKYNKNGSGLQFPVTVTWNNGTTRQITTKPQDSDTLDRLENLPSGAYSVTVTHALGCKKSLQTHLACSDHHEWGSSADVPTFYLLDNLPGQPVQSDSCYGVFVDHFSEITSFAFNIFSLSSNTIQEIKDINLPNFSINNFTFYPNESDFYSVAWENPYPVSLPNATQLFKVCPTPTTQSTLLAFYMAPGPMNVIQNFQTPSAYHMRSGFIRFSGVETTLPSVCSIGIKKPDCSNDNMYKISVTTCDPSKRSNLYINGYLPTNTLSPYFSAFNGKIGSFFNVTHGLFTLEGHIGETQNLPHRYHLSYIYLPLPPPAQECVWPGDADNNGAVNHHDLLYIGAAFGASGPARPNASNEWHGQDADHWEQQSQGRHVNYKNIDTDGNGTVDAADTLALVRNWTKVIDPTVHNPFGKPAEQLPGALAPKLYVQDDTIVAGLTNLMPLLLGTPDQPVENVGGIAFSVQYDPSVMTGEVRFVPNDSWFADMGHCLYVQKDFRGQGRLDVAIVRTDGNMASGWGAIGNLLLGVDERPLDGATAAKTYLLVNGLNAVDLNADNKAVEGQRAELTLLGRSASSLSAKQPGWENTLTVFPNPAQGIVCAESKAAAIQQAAIYDLMGKLRSRISASGHQMCAPIENLPAGTYLLQILTERGSTVRKFTVAR